MREWNSYSDDLTIDGNVVKEYTIRFKTTEYEVYKRIEDFFQRLMDEPHTTPESYLAKALRFSRDSHEIAKTEPQTDYTPDCPFCKRYGTEDCLGSDCRHYKTYKTDYRITGTIGYRCPKCGRGNFLIGESNCVYCGEPLIKDEPQTDCPWKGEE